MTQRPPAEIRRVGGSTVYRNNWLAVTHDEIERADGSRGIYGVVHKQDFALVIPYERGGFHLVEQFRYPVGERGWEFPQGGWPATADDHLEALRLDPDQGIALAAHELAEETGFVAATLTHLGYLNAASGYSDQGFHIVLATELSAGEPALEHEEQGLVSAFFSLTDLWALIDSGALKDAATIAALALWERRTGLGLAPAAHLARSHGL